jgi:hypothetical protein
MSVRISFGVHKLSGLWGTSLGSAHQARTRIQCHGSDSPLQTADIESMGEMGSKMD